MPRRMNLPGASELFRPTGVPEQGRDIGTALAPDIEADSQTEQIEKATPIRTSGRTQHDDKITVYVSRAELLALEQARLRLRGDLGLNVDRGRIVREAIAIAMDELDHQGGDSQLFQRLSQ